MRLLLSLLSTPFWCGDLLFREEDGVASSDFILPTQLILPNHHQVNTTNEGDALYYGIVSRVESAID